MVPKLYFLLAWPTKNRPPSKGWTSKSKLRSHGVAGVPFGGDRLILIYLATEAKRQGARIRGTVRDLRARFGPGWTLERTRERLVRVAGMWYEQVRQGSICSRHHQIVHGFSWCDAAQDAFELTVSDPFLQHANEGAPCSCAVIRRLGNRNADIDLYLWMAWHRHRDADTTLAAAGAHGPYARLASARDPYKCRQVIRERLRRIRQAWPSCPYRLSQDRARFVHEPGRPDTTRRPAKARPAPAPHIEPRVIPRPRPTIRRARETTTTEPAARGSPSSVQRPTRATDPQQATRRGPRRPRRRWPR